MIDRRAVPLARVPAFGWAWHGLMRDPVTGSGNPTIYLPNGRTYVGERSGRDRVLRVWSWTYLWDVGRPDLEQTEVEAERGARFDGRAILRGFGGSLYAYGAVYFGSNDPRDQIGWPVRFDGRTGRALLRQPYAGEAPPDTWELLIYPEIVLGGQPVEPVAFLVDVSLSALGQGAGQPDLYEGPELLAPLVEGVSLSVLDISRDGRSLLLGVKPQVTGHLSRMRNVTRWCGLLRLDITGNPGSPGNIGYQLIVEQDRRAALGELVDELSSSMPAVARYTTPMETVSTVQPWPACGIDERVQTAGFTATPNSSPPIRSVEGSESYRYGQTGVMAGAWFGAAGAVEVLRFDSLLEQTLETTVANASTGERRERRVFSAGPTECTAEPMVITDDRAYRLNGQITDDRSYRLTLRGPGGAVDEHLLRVVSTTTEWYDSTRDPYNQRTGRTVVEFNGAVVFDETSPPDGGTLSPGAATPFGFHIPALVSRYHTEVGGLSVGNHQIRVLTGSNKIVLLGHLERTNAGPDPVTFSVALTPAGATGAPITRYAQHDTDPTSSRYGFDSVDAGRLTDGTYNPITHQVERHREDRAICGWV